jgi:hypothetical protein
MCVRASHTYPCLSRFFAPCADPLSPDINCTYRLNSLELAPGAGARAVAIASITYLYTDASGRQEVAVYDDPDTQDAETFPPEAWPATARGTMRTLITLRLSSTALNVLTAVGAVQNKFDFYGSQPVLDTNLSLTTHLARPRMAVATDGTIVMSVDEGYLSATCQSDVDGHATNETLVKFNFSSLLGNGSGVLETSANGTLLVTVRVNEIDTNSFRSNIVEPKFPIPEAFEDGFCKDLLARVKTPLNGWLKTNGFSIPAELNEYLINPTMRVRWQFAGHGYVEMASFCSCNGGGVYKPCLSPEICALSHVQVGPCARGAAARS